MEAGSYECSTEVLLRSTVFVNFFNACRKHPVLLSLIFPLDALLTCF